MSEAVKRQGENNPKDYSPEIPKFLGLMDELSGERVIDRIVIEGVEFTVIEKGKTFYAGKYAEEPEKIDDVYSTDEQILFGDNRRRETDEAVRYNLTPHRTIILNMNYTAKEKPCAMLRGHETASLEQPEGIFVIEAEPTLLIKTKLTYAAFALVKKITGRCIDQYHMSALFDLIKQIFCGESMEYDYNGDNGTGNTDAEHYPFKGEDGEKYNPNVVTNAFVTVPVKRKIGCKIGGEKGRVADEPSCPQVWTWDKIDEAQEPAKTFERISFGGRGWLVLESRNGKALIISEKIIENRQFHHEDTEITWELCDLRKYLNESFYRNGFSDEDRAKIIKTSLPPYINPWYGLSNGKSRLVNLRERDNKIYESAGKATEDYVFILSVEETVKYFGDSGDLEKRIGYTWMGEEHMDSLGLGDGFGQFLIDRYQHSRIALDADGNPCSYLLRTPGYQYHYIVGVGGEGRFFPLTGGGVNQELGVRPAMWINL